MAANPKLLEVVGARVLGPHTRELEVECVEGGAFDVVGGKYVIVHTGLVQGEKAVKRAYSLMPCLARPGRATLAVKRLAGLGSRAMHDAPVGSTFTFSGPWGKLVPEAGLAERTLLVATDTGITSALGIVEQQAVSGARAALGVLWLREPSETFLDVAGVRARVERAGVQLSVHEVGPVASPERAGVAPRLIESLALALEASDVVATGDGAVVHPLRERLPGRVPTVKEVRVECFFNNPEKKSA